MDMIEQTQPGEIPPSKEHIGHPTPVAFYKLGGTWDMVERNGRRVGTGRLDDDALNKCKLN